MGIKKLPADLTEALDLMDKSDLARTVLGEEFLKHYIAAKRAHIEGYKRSLGSNVDDPSYRIRISRYEIENLLPIL